MKKYTVFFINDQQDFVKDVTVVATDKNRAYEKAEQIYKTKGWKFRYVDLLADG